MSPIPAETRSTEWHISVSSTYLPPRGLTDWLNKDAARQCWGQSQHLAWGRPLPNLFWSVKLEGPAFHMQLSGICRLQRIFTHKKSVVIPGKRPLNRRIVFGMEIGLHESSFVVIVEFGEIFIFIRPRKQENFGIESSDSKATHRMKSPHNWSRFYTHSFSILIDITINNISHQLPYSVPTAFLLASSYFYPIII